MNKSSLLRLLWLALLFGCSILLIMGIVSLIQNPSQSATIAPTYKIMPLGDSITRGIGQGGEAMLGYRGQLNRNLKAGAIQSGFKWQWVGSVTEPSAPGLPHEGHGGWTVDQIYDSITGWQATYKPDIILLHIGTNNVTQGEATAVTARKILLLCQRIRLNQPNVRVFLARIIGVAASTSIAEQKLNVDLSNTMGITALKAGAGFYSVDFRNIRGEALFDHHHPNEFGYIKMAYQWYQAMRAVFGPWLSVANPYARLHYTICQFNYTTQTRVCHMQKVN